MVVVLSNSKETLGSFVIMGPEQKQTDHPQKYCSLKNSKKSKTNVQMQLDIHLDAPFLKAFKSWKRANKDAVSEEKLKHLENQLITSFGFY